MSANSVDRFLSGSGGSTHLRVGRFLFGIVAVSAFSLSACGGSSSELAVDVRTDLLSGIEFDEVRVSLDGGEPLSQVVTVGEDFGRARRVGEFRGVRTGRRVIEVALLREGAPVTSRRISLRFENSTTVLAVLTRDCVRVTCPSETGGTATECLGGRCVDPGCHGGAPDLCGPLECRVQGDCPDAAACAVAECVEGACLYLDDGTSCSSREVCAPDEGCIPRDGERDAGVDAGVDAGSPRVPPTAVFQSAGGGSASSERHRARISIGAPQPAGTTAGEQTSASLGAAAAGR